LRRPIELAIGVWSLGYGTTKGGGERWQKAAHEAFVGFGGVRLRAVRNPSASAAADVEGVQSVEMDVLPSDGTVAIDEFVRARAETIGYHETLYRSASLGTHGSWLAHPHPLVMDSLGLVTCPVHAYDLGAGVGRHTLPIVAGLPAGSRVTAVDLIPSALASLVENAAAAGLSNRIETVSADLESWTFPADDAGLIVAFSALEHRTKWPTSSPTLPPKPPGSSLAMSSPCADRASHMRNGLRST
jgi:hypothetical protein